ncbi:hypothetical protein B0J11DRAFT_530223 [Dendryphion nanum]|uniref:Borealin N-terminal domain-containing protein n=1 Tax=Dendryphion nanum TaxID=256645 RepID=A0A9P9ILR3_9PLEO|nr:hypothetical protein B0J11DRAFT_530223 [Dendryphion nanum]
MSRGGLSDEAKATIRANLELELNARKEKLLAMCEAQVASLRSRLERRINRVPTNKRNMKIMDLINASVPAKPTAAKKEAVAPAPANTRRARPAAQTAPPAAAPAPRAAPVSASAPAPRRVTSKTTTTAKQTTTTAKTVVAKPTRGVKRTSDEISGEDKENSGDMGRPLPKLRMAKRVKAPTTTATTTTAAPATTRPARATRAASKKVDVAPQVLSPKTNNARPAPQTRTRRPR